MITKAQLAILNIGAESSLTSKLNWCPIYQPVTLIVAKATTTWRHYQLDALFLKKLMIYRENKPSKKWALSPLI